jgi:hypothetical protein
VAGEVSNLLMARLHASFSERSLKSEVSTSVQAAGGGQVTQPVDGEGLLIGLAISGAASFRVAPGPESHPRRDAGPNPGTGTHRRIGGISAGDRFPPAASRARGTLRARGCRVPGGRRLLRDDRAGASMPSSGVHVTADEECSCDHSTGRDVPHAPARQLASGAHQRAAVVSGCGTPRRTACCGHRRALPAGTRRAARAGSPNPPLQRRAPRRPSARPPARQPSTARLTSARCRPRASKRSRQSGEFPYSAHSAHSARACFSGRWHMGIRRTIRAAACVAACAALLSRRRRRRRR